MCFDIRQEGAIYPKRSRLSTTDSGKNRRKPSKMSMTDTPLSEEDPLVALRGAVLDHALPHVAFDGWSDKTLAAAVSEAGVDASLARIAFPRGGVDLALAWHDAKDRELAQRLAASDLAGLRFRDRIAHAIALRLELVAADREAVRRAVAMFALPHLAMDGGRAIWRTADTIWDALGDTSRDFNWYSKRATLSTVYSSCLLYWLGDTSPGASATREFIHRRIDNVMSFEETKAKIAGNPLAAAVLKGPQRLLDRVRAPGDSAALPGRRREG
jgi:ubiquinone biosynthesis protein COQ9